jgi:hypothetical protein
VRIPARFNGPPRSAQGGVAAGRLAAYVGAPAVEVTLRRPPPLDRDLRVDASGGGARLHDGDLLVAEAVPAPGDLTALDPGPPVPVEQAAATPATPPAEHPFPTCVACGPARPDGLRLEPGPLPDGRTACVWTPADDDPVLVWAALDCPGGFAAGLVDRPMLLGRMALTRTGALRPGEPHVVLGWRTGGEGRKTHTGSSLHAADGSLLALARATWLTVPATA